MEQNAELLNAFERLHAAFVEWALLRALLTVDPAMYFEEVSPAERTAAAHALGLQAWEHLLPLVKGGIGVTAPVLVLAVAGGSSVLQRMVWAIRRPCPLEAGRVMPVNFINEVLAQQRTAALYAAELVRTLAAVTVAMGQLGTLEGKRHSAMVALLIGEVTFQ